MPIVKIYSKVTCPYCVRAKNWFKQKNVEFEEILLDAATPDIKQAFFKDCPGAKTVPQIIVDDNLIGGYDNLIEKEGFVKRLLDK